MKRIFPLLLWIGVACNPVEPVSNCASEVASDKWATLDQAQLLADMKSIDDYLDTNGLTAIEHPSGVRIVITQFGSGENVPCVESLVSATYEGKLFTNFTIFDSTVKPFVRQLSGTIVGWQIGFLEMNKGTKATLFIPSGLGYGDEDIYTGFDRHIPANSILVFDVELLDYR
jgi:FKBP-type peptidyl-prolyl cis-trans isomerase